MVGIAAPASTPATYSGLALSAREMREAVPSAGTGYTWCATTNAYAGADPFVGTPSPTGVSGGADYLNRLTVTLSAAAPA